MDTVTASFELPLRQHYRAYRVAFHRQPSVWIAYAFFGLLPPAILVAAHFARGTPWAELWSEHWRLLIWGPLFIVAGVPLLHLMNVRQLRSRNRTLAGAQSYAFSRDGFRTWGPLFNTAVLWDGVDRVVETRGYLLIYVSAVAAYFVPVAAVPPAERPALRQILHDSLGERARVAPMHRSAA